MDRSAMWTSLIGFMGSGKSVIARMAANRSLLTLIDLDQEIAEKHERTISEIFADAGEAAFREVEVETLASLHRDRDVLLSCGGGVVQTPEAREILRRHGVVIWLDVSWRILWQRLKDGHGAERPLVEELGESALEALYRRRRVLYAATADFRLSCDTTAEEEIARQVLYCRSRYLQQGARG